MATLIGTGAHGSDILAFGGFRDVVAHHSLWSGVPEVVVLGINDPHERARVAYELQVKDLTWIHPDALIGHGCKLGTGTHVNYRVSMIRTTIGEHCTISPGVVICGDVTIGDRVLVGAGAVLCDRVRVGDDVTIGAGTIVLPEMEIPEGTTWVGNPARQVMEKVGGWRK